MYPYERKLGSIKRKIKNQAKVEGSIVQAYIVGEISTFCSQYFEPTKETRLNREPRNFAPDIPSDARVDSRLSIFKVPSRRLFEKGGQRRILSDDELRIAHNYILINCEEVYPFIRMFEDFARHEQPHIDEGTFARFRDQYFADWFKNHVSHESYNSNLHIKGLARGPFRHVLSHKGYYVNGYKFHTEKYGDGRITHNSGVCVKGTCYDEDECDYYELLDEVLEVEYQGVGRCVVVLFKCTWFDADKGVNVDRKHNLVDIKYKSRLRNNDPFILASQATQVYYASYPSMTRYLKEWWAVVKTKPRSIYELPQNTSEEANDDDEEEEDEEHFFQESEAQIDTTSSYENVVEELKDLEDEGEAEEVDVNDRGDTYMEESEEEEFDDNLEDSEDEEEYNDSDED